ncbi:MAG: hypothetical protein GOU99_03985 [Candidatus Altiarchaeota archaeon]|nr:hypothetical protein [Candidatus Altiarchaeota archaeon]
MKIVVFDFDNTLTKERGTPRFKWLVKRTALFTLPIWWLFEKLTHKPVFHRKMIQALKGVQLGKLLDTSEKLKERSAVLHLMKIFNQKGYRIIVLSYNFKPVIENYLLKRGIEPEIYAPSLIIVNGEIVGYSDDWVTQAYLDEPRNAKRVILKKLNIVPNIAVGDNKKRDDLGAYYVPSNRAGSILRGMGGQML